MKTNTLRLAVQKDGRLTEETLGLLRASGLEFESYGRKLFSACRNFPMNIVYVRDDDIPSLVATGTVDIGILGQNVLNEKRAEVKKLLNLRYGFCTLAVSVPKESSVSSVSDLAGKIIATSYPKSAARFFREQNINVTIIPIEGSVEVMPSLGAASAIVDLVSSGSTLLVNDLRLLTPIYRSEAVLIANTQSIRANRSSQRIRELVTRFKSVLSAKNCKFIIFTAPQAASQKLKKIIPSLTPRASQAQTTDSTLEGVVNEEAFWSMLGRLRALGATNIRLMPIENSIL